MATLAQMTKEGVLKGEVAKTARFRLKMNRGAAPKSVPTFWQQWERKTGRKAGSGRDNHLLQQVWSEGRQQGKINKEKKKHIVEDWHRV